MKKAFSLFLLFSLAFTAMSFQTANTGGGYRVGDTAMDFSLINVKGKPVSLAGIKNAKGYIVVFTCNHCPYAKAYEQRIIDLHKKYAPMGFSVVAINSNDKDVQPQDSYDNMKKLAKKDKYPFPYLYDETQEVAKAYGATRTPHVYVLDKDRVVRYIGAIDDNSEDPAMVKEQYVANAVDALLSGKDIKTKETKAIGCGIKWKKS
jgi:peroxiredoxin